MKFYIFEYCHRPTFTLASIIRYSTCAPVSRVRAFAGPLSVICHSIYALVSEPLPEHIFWRRKIGKIPQFYQNFPDFAGPVPLE